MIPGMDNQDNAIGREEKQKTTESDIICSTQSAMEMLIACCLNPAVCFWYPLTGRIILLQYVILFSSSTGASPGFISETVEHSTV